MTAAAQLASILNPLTGTINVSNGTSGTQAVNYSQFPDQYGDPMWIELPNGFILQGGSYVFNYTTTSQDPGSLNVPFYYASYSIPFPKTFPNACVTASVQGNPGFGGIQFAVLSGFSTSSLSFEFDSTSTNFSNVRVWWMAMGY